MNRWKSDIYSEKILLELAKIRGRPSNQWEALIVRVALMLTTFSLFFAAYSENYIQIISEADDVQCPLVMMTKAGSGQGQSSWLMSCWRESLSNTFASDCCGKWKFFSFLSSKAQKHVKKSLRYFTPQMEGCKNLFYRIRPQTECEWSCFGKMLSKSGWMVYLGD